MSNYTADEKQMIRWAESALIGGIVFFCASVFLRNWQAFAVAAALWIVTGVIIVVVAFASSAREAKEKVDKIWAEGERQRTNEQVRRFIAAMNERSRQISKKLEDNNRN